MILSIVAGLALLVAGGEALVRGAAGLAARLGVSPLLIGLTVVGFGTSTPELVTSLQAALSGSPGLALGNVVGSNVANALLILGVAALLFPVAVDRRAFARDGTALMLVTTAALGLVLWGAVGRLAGVALLAGLGLYLWLAWRGERGGATGTVGAPAAPTGRLLVYAAGGIALTILGARLLVDGSVALAGSLGVSEAVIGLTVVAVGTSLPELVTSVIAALKRQGGLAFGNVVGSNLYNLLGILGATAAVSPLAVPEGMGGDAAVMLGATVALVAVAVTGWRVRRAEGALLLAAYAAYVGWLVVRAG